MDTGGRDVTIKLLSAFSDPAAEIDDV